MYKTKVLNEMMDKREYGLSFLEECDFELYVSENYNLSALEIQEIWELYKPTIEEQWEEDNLPLI